MWVADIWSHIAICEYLASTTMRRSESSLVRVYLVTSHCINLKFSRCLAGWLLGTCHSMLCHFLKNWSKTASLQLSGILFFISESTFGEGSIWRTTEFEDFGQKIILCGSYIGLDLLDNRNYFSFYSRFAAAKYGLTTNQMV